MIEKRSTRLKTKLVHGVGVNDHPYAVKVDNKICKIYAAWRDMLRRCYVEDFKGKSKTYDDCTVCEEWHIYSNFRSWAIKQDIEDKALDKDIKFFGNKIYSPDTCMFVTLEINNLLCDAGSIRGDAPKGVYYRKDRGTYQARCWKNGKCKSLGCYRTKEEAEAAYLKSKATHIKNLAIYYANDNELSSALLRHYKRLTTQ